MWSRHDLFNKKWRRIYLLFNFFKLFGRFLTFLWIFPFCFLSFKRFWLRWTLVDNCSYISNEGNAKWNETIANGKIINGECLNGYQGFITRKCIQFGSIGNWTSISGSCNGIQFSFFFISYSLFSLIQKKL